MPRAAVVGEQVQKPSLVTRGDSGSGGCVWVLGRLRSSWDMAVCVCPAVNENDSHTPKKGYLSLQYISESMFEVNHGHRPPYPSTETVLDQLRHHVTRTPAACAVVVPEGEFQDGLRLSLTYSELWAALGRIAKQLAKAQARRASRWVLVVLPQGLQQVCAVWGVLAAGCGYVPIDAETEAPRLRTLCCETMPTVAIGATGPTPLSHVAAQLDVPLATFWDGALHGLVIGDCRWNDATLESVELPSPTTGDLALLLFSSGSTGVPKGIVYDHKWLMGGSYFVGRDLELTAASHCLLRCSYVWSVSLYDLFPANMFGGTLFIPPP